MGRSIICDLLESATQVKCGTLRRIRGQAHDTEIQGRIGQEVLYQRLPCVLASGGGRDVYPAQPADVRSGVRIIRKTSDANQLPITEDPKKAFTGSIKSVVTVLPFFNQTRKKPESFCSCLRFEHLDFRGER